MLYCYMQLTPIFALESVLKVITVRLQFEHHLTTVSWRSFRKSTQVTTDDNNIVGKLKKGTRRKSNQVEVYSTAGTINQIDLQTPTENREIIEFSLDFRHIHPYPMRLSIFFVFLVVLSYVSADPPVCRICRNIVNEIKKFQGPTDGLQNFLDNWCDTLPASGLCKKLVAMFLPQMQDDPSDSICSILHLCPPIVFVVDPVVKEMVKQNTHRSPSNLPVEKLTANESMPMKPVQ
ncbi:hypothetical protein PROFUN_11530 [Planoprotostelium fungivorum]|uniref:Saposin B-type domain-containing protein n=1 Tax=Planoprotostelium fungivorum TaxID=1890364 RepID=A0A2P6NA21_9EUKA|nr:hypothetical protein PROFUN_11530 [Planoprotostelium fungivorum]